MKLSKSRPLARYKWSCPALSSRATPAPRWGHAATLVKSDPPTLLITGGDAKDKSGKPLTLSDSLVYQACSHTWTKAHGNTALARAFHTANIVDGVSGKMLVVFGGENNTPGKKEVLGNPLFMDLDEDDSIWWMLLPGCKHPLALAFDFC